MCPETLWIEQIIDGFWGDRECFRPMCEAGEMCCG